jgi:integrase
LIAITDGGVRALKFATHQTYTLRDNRLPAFRVQVGKTVKSFRFEGEYRRKGKRVSVSRWLGNHPDLKASEARRKCHEIQGDIAKGVIAPGRRQALSLQSAMQTHVAALEAKAKRDGKKPSWANETQRLYTKHMTQWAKRSLVDLSNSPEEVAQWHVGISEQRGHSEADHAARALHACYRRAAKLTRGLPMMSPTSAVEPNQERDPERKVDRSIPFKSFPIWAAQVREIERESPLRACFHRLNLYTGMRPGELARLSWEGVGCKARTIKVERGKTRPIANYRGLYVFPSRKSASGHLENWLADKLDWRGHTCRHAHATVAASLSIDPYTARLLASHSARDVHEQYVSRADLLNTTLRKAQRAVSQKIEKLMGEGK